MAAQHTWHQLERQDIGDVTVLRFGTRRLQTEEQVRPLFQQLCRLVDDLGRSRLVLDLGGVEFIDSSAIGKLVMLNRKARLANGGLALCCLEPDVARILATMHLDDLFQVWANADEAIQSLAGPPVPGEKGS
jgi:anti-anti-sigma factor